MRGCLITIAVLVVVALAAVWLALPPLIGTLAQGALVAAGFAAEATTVTVEADPPPELLTLRADAIRVQATNARFHGVEAVDVDVTLHDVQLVERTFETLDGTLRFVTFPATGDRPEISVPEARLSGDPDHVRATMTFPAPAARDLAAAAIEGRVGVPPSEVSLTGPDRVRIAAGGQTIEARLAVRDDGALLLLPQPSGTIGPIVLVEPGPEVPFRIVSFRVLDGGLVVVATFDPALG